MVTTKTTYTTNVTFYGDIIHTTVTKCPFSVTDWINETENDVNHQVNDHLVVGLHIESSSYDKVDILQLCVKKRCLIFQISHSPFVPHVLINFLNYPSYTFVGVGINTNVEKLVKCYKKIGVKSEKSLGANVADLGDGASKVYRTSMNSLDLTTLASIVLEKDLMKLSDVSSRLWDNQWLRKKQVDYASSIGFLCFEIARVLISKGEILS